MVDEASESFEGGSQEAASDIVDHRDSEGEINQLPNFNQQCASQSKFEIPDDVTERFKLRYPGEVIYVEPVDEMSFDRASECDLYSEITEVVTNEVSLEQRYKRLQKLIQKKFRFIRSSKWFTGDQQDSLPGGTWADLKLADKNLSKFDPQQGKYNQTE